MNAPTSVLVTGSSGRVGRAAVAALLARGHRVRGMDRTPSPELAECVVGNITDPQATLRAAEGMDTLIHLAATPDDDDFMSQLLPNNIIGLFNVMEAARQSGLTRMILASSGQLHSGQVGPGPFPVRVTDPITPRYWYASTKAFLECAGQTYSTRHGMHVIAVRLGWCPRDQSQVREIAATPWAPDIYLSPSDAGRFFVSVVEAPPASGFCVVFATSKPAKMMRYDLQPARELFGFEPQETWPEGVVLE